MARLKEVFVAGGLPSITYISRDEYDLESTMRDYIDALYKLLSISGSTKSGKMVLVRKTIPKQGSFWIPGGQVTDLNSFWELVLEETGGYTRISHQHFSKWLLSLMQQSFCQDPRKNSLLFFSIPLN